MVVIKIDPGATSRTRMSLSPAKIGSQSSVIRGNTLSPQRSRTDEPQSTRQDSIDPFIRLKEKSTRKHCQNSSFNGLCNESNKSKNYCQNYR